MAQYMNGSAAVELGHDDSGHHLTLVAEQPRRVRHTNPEVYAGAHARTQTALSPLAVTAIKCAGVFVAVLVVASLMRVFIMAMAFGFASQNASINVQLETARSQGAELEVQQSVYGSSERIKSIATDVYGMVPAADVAVLDLSAPIVAVAPEADAE